MVVSKSVVERGNKKAADRGASKAHDQVGTKFSITNQPCNRLFYCRLFHQNEPVRHFPQSKAAADKNEQNFALGNVTLEI